MLLFLCFWVGLLLLQPALEALFDVVMYEPVHTQYKEVTGKQKVPHVVLS